MKAGFYLEDLPAVDRDAIRVGYTSAVNGVICQCGREKWPGHFFCQLCRGELSQAGLATDFLRATQQYRACRDPYLVLYEPLVDVLLALKAGRWDGKRERRRRDDEVAA